MKWPCFFIVVGIFHVSEGRAIQGISNSRLKFCRSALHDVAVAPNGHTHWCGWIFSNRYWPALLGVGGKIKTDTGKELEYGKKNFKNKNFIAEIL